MNLLKQKQFTKEIDCGIFSIYQTLTAYRDCFKLPDNFRNSLDSFIDYCEGEIYPSLPSEKRS